MKTITSQNLSILVLILIGGIVGLGVGEFLRDKDILPLWSKYEIDTNGLDIQEILLGSYDYYSNSEPHNRIYVRTTEGHIYIFSRESESWQQIKPFNADTIEKLGFSWDGDGVVAVTAQGQVLRRENDHWEIPTGLRDDSRLTDSNPCKDYKKPFLPTWLPHKDNEGGLHVFVASTTKFCTLLLENGRLQTWHHDVNALDMIFIDITFIILGMFGGGCVGIYIKKKSH